MYITAAGEEQRWRKGKAWFYCHMSHVERTNKPLIDPISQERSANYKLLKEEISRKDGALYKGLVPGDRRKNH